jgi:hypothetical protein
MNKLFFIGLLSMFFVTNPSLQAQDNRQNEKSFSIIDQ